ncbi:hypothetical protein LTR06_011225 [Exophiala xenobiotica]|nr:hypothetical protein LTR06_011225 [Exophiala xenobiotica]
MSSPITFAEILPIKQISSHKYTFNFSQDWCTGTVPSGGYVASAFLIAARTHMQLTHPSRQQPDVINCHLTYLRPSSVGPVIITVQDVKLGSRISNLHLVLSQRRGSSLSDSELPINVQASVIMSSIALEKGISHQTGYELRPPRLPVDLAALRENKDVHYIRRRPDAFSAYRRAARNVEMYFVRPEARTKDHSPALVDMWACLVPVGLTDPGCWTNDALGFLADIFTGINERYANAEVEDALLRENTTDAELASLMKQSSLGNGEARFWYPTLVLNLDVKKRLPAPGAGKEDAATMLFVRVQAKKILNGRMDLAVEIWDESGDLVALSSHASLIMDASRNMKRGAVKAGSKI